MEKDEVLGLEEIGLEPFTLLHDILVNWWVILMGAIGAALMASVVLNSSYVPQYTASATFVVSSKESVTVFSNWSAASEMADTLKSILKSNTMNKIICEELGVDSIDAQISAETMGDTNLLELRVTAGTSKEAMSIIRAVMDNYTRVSYYAMGDTIMDVLEEPEVPMYPDNPLNTRTTIKKVFVLMAALLTLLIGFISYLRDTIKCEADIEKKLDARSLGVIPFETKYKTMKELFGHKKRALLVNSPIAGFAFVESYKKLATKVDYQMMKKGEKVLVVTSVSENEGKSTVAANLAITLAEQSKKVILIEGDLRRPSQFLIFEKQPEERQEIGEFLNGDVGLKDIIIKSGIQNLYLITGRNCYSSSTEMVSSLKMKEMLEYCKRKVDYVIIDSPPAGLTGDAEVLAEYAGCVLLVTKQNLRLSEEINDVLDAFRSHHSSVLGVVLNGVITFSEVLAAGDYGKYGRYGKYAKIEKD